MTDRIICPVCHDGFDVPEGKVLVPCNPPGNDTHEICTPQEAAKALKERFGQGLKERFGSD